MVDIVQEHFKTLPNQEISFDENNFYLFNKLIPDNFNSKYFKNINKDEINKKFHINYFTFRKLFELIPSLKNPDIIETGSSAHGTNSSILFDKYIYKYGGTFKTVDINSNTTVNVNSKFLSNNSRAFTNDSVEFIKNLENNSVDVVYLDSYDIDWINYHPSAEHGKKELENIIPKLKQKSYILIDDTPSIPEYLLVDNQTYNNVKSRFEIEKIMPGKGMWSEHVLKTFNNDLTYKKIIHQYQVLYEINKINNL